MDTGASQIRDSGVPITLYQSSAELNQIDLLLPFTGSLHEKRKKIRKMIILPNTNDKQSKQTPWLVQVLMLHSPFQNAWNRGWW